MTKMFNGNLFVSSSKRNVLRAIFTAPNVAIPTISTKTIVLPLVFNLLPPLRHSAGVCVVGYVNESIGFSVKMSIDVIP